MQIVLRLIADDQASGAFNMTSPNPVTNKTFTQMLVKLQKGLVVLSAPSLLMKMLLGERAGLLVEGQKFLPQKIQTSSYQFIYPGLLDALNSLLSKP